MSGIPGLRILQHNVQHWRTHRHQLVEIYRTVDPDVILINSHGLRNDEDLKIPGYRVMQHSQTQEVADGAAIAFRSNLRIKKLSIGSTGLLKIEIPTEYDSVVIATHYLPPRCQDALMTDVLQDVANSHQPYYFVGDLNASARVLRDSRTNDRGRVLAAYVQNQRVEHITTDFNTFFGPN